MKLSSNIAYHQSSNISLKPCAKEKNSICTNNFDDFNLNNFYFLPNFNGLFYKKADFHKCA